MAKRALIFGQGYVSRHILEQFERDGWLVESIRWSKEIRIPNNIDVVINATGFSGINNIDDCEYMQDRTYFANTTIATQIAVRCADAKKRLIHISSGCMWGQSREAGGEPTIGSTYVKSKRAAEQAIAGLMHDNSHIIARIRMPFCNRDSRRNLISKLISYPQVWDCPWFSASHLPSTMLALANAASEWDAGVHNFVNPGTVDNKSICHEFLSYFGLKKQIVQMPADNNRSFIELKPSKWCEGVGDVRECVYDCLEDWKWR